MQRITTIMATDFEKHFIFALPHLPDVNSYCIYARSAQSSPVR